MFSFLLAFPRLLYMWSKDDWEEKEESDQKQILTRNQNYHHRDVM